MPDDRLSRARRTVRAAHHQRRCAGLDPAGVRRSEAAPAGAPGRPEALASRRRDEGRRRRDDTRRSAARDAGLGVSRGGQDARVRAARSVKTSPGAGGALPRIVAFGRGSEASLKIKSERDFWSGMMFVAVGVVFAIGAMNYSMGPPCPTQDACATSLWARMSHLSAHPGAGYFPLGLSVLLAILGAFVLFKSLTIESVGGDPIGAFAWRPLLIIIAAIAVFGLMLEPLGLALTVPVLIFMSSLAGDEFHWKGVLVNAIVLTVSSWAIFIWGLKLTIPLWPAFIG